MTNPTDTNQSSEDEPMTKTAKQILLEMSEFDIRKHPEHLDQALKELEAIMSELVIGQDEYTELLRRKVAKDMSGIVISQPVEVKEFSENPEQASRNRLRKIQRPALQTALYGKED